MSAAQTSRGPGSIHATALVIGEAGILIRGRSGRGKSALALALLDMAGERGLFARLIGDDRIHIEAHGHRTLASGAPGITGLIERRGIGLARVGAEPAAVVRLVVDLLPEGEALERLPEEAAGIAALGDARLPRLAFDATSRPNERAAAILAALGEGVDKFVTISTHFA